MLCCLESCKKTVIDGNAPGLVITALPEIPPEKYVSVLSGTEPLCWRSIVKKPYFSVHFGMYSVLCGLQYSSNGSVELRYGTDTLNKSQVKFENHALSATAFSSLFKI